jgi:aminoglycoside phosphotransferase family enzyme/predicted kinase
MGDLKADLIAPGIDLVETHTAWVFLGDETVWKVKKPVDYGFLDYSTADKRRLACDAEVRLNGRLAPDVYDSVVPITRDGHGHHAISGNGEVVDYAVRMVRLPDARRADIRLEEGRLSRQDIDGVAEHLARFHANMPSGPDIARFGDPELILSNVRENFAQTRGTITAFLDGRESSEIETKQVRFVEEHRGLFYERMQEGRIRDGHGDLRLEHVYLSDGRPPTIIDCIEFNDRFRYADVCADIAFLSMDLERLGRADLAEAFLAGYARASGDYDLYPLVDFYEGYRAYVRGKVASIQSADPGADHRSHERAKKDARHAYLLALSEGRERLLEPAVIVVGGLIASGKSTIAESIGSMTSAPIVDADRTRKALLGVAPTSPMEDPAWSGAYAPEVTERVYRELFRRAGSVLRSRRSVVLDASFRSRALRDEARKLAREHGVPFYFVECRADPDECRRRLRRRAETRTISDGRLEIFDDFLARWERIDEIAPREHVVVDTSLSIDENAKRLMDTLPSWPPGLTR